MIKVIKAGFYSSIQDNGRFGYRHYGVPISGAMDMYSYQFANLFLGNKANTSVIEITMTGPTLKFLKPTFICNTGANMSPQCNGKPVEMNKPIKIYKNDIVSFGKSKSGFRSYIAIKNGFKSEFVLGSQSMYDGVTKQYKLSNGDKLHYDTFYNDINLTNANVRYKSSSINDNYLKVYKGIEFDMLNVSQQQLLFNTEFKISKYNNRMAYQLTHKIENNLDSIITSPVLPGTVQLTPSGQLIILMRDCQTTGGYPRILQLTEKAINILSQKTTSNRIKFKRYCS